MSAHTAGPWFVNPLKAWVEIPSADAPICAMLWPTDLREEDETFANARLIAVAPDLLRELETAQQRECSSWCAPSINEHTSYCISQRAAIAKARGEA